MRYTIIAHGSKQSQYPILDTKTDEVVGTWDDGAGIDAPETVLRDICNAFLRGDVEVWGHRTSDEVEEPLNSKKDGNGKAKPKIVSIEKIDGKISVKSPYAKALPARARKLGGRWNGSAWLFDERDEDRVRDLYREVYGTDGSDDVELVTLRVEVGSWPWSEHQSSLEIAGRIVARAYGRDSGAKLGDGVVILSGSVGSGGSRKNWTTVASTGTIIEVRDVPKQIAETEVENSTKDLTCTIV